MRAALIAVALVLGADPGGASDNRLRIEVTPRVSMAPASVRVRAIVEPHTENRALQIVIDSGDYFRSSVVPLEGADAAAVTEATMKNVPSGQYEISVALVDASGERTFARRLIVVTSPQGEP